MNSRRPDEDGIGSSGRIMRQGDPIVNSDPRPVILRAEGVTKRFGPVVAVDRVDYQLRQHEVAGILGSNGAGKTSFFNLLTGYYFPTEGKIFYKGQDITNLTPQQRVSLGMMRTFQLTSTFDNLSVTDNLVLSFFRAHRNSSLLNLFFSTRKRYRDDENIHAALDQFNLRALSDRLVTHLSLGEKRRMEIAMAVIAKPEVLLLDEPLAGLAEPEIKGVLDVLRKQVGKQTILIVEHKISHVKDFLERLIVMHEGRIIAEGGYEECLRHPEVRKSYWQIDTPEEDDDQDILHDH
jgi:ABC-type branched-chain amino acid transport systems, ATPase component